MEIIKDLPEVFDLWKTEILRFKEYLKEKFEVTITQEQVREAVKLDRTLITGCPLRRCDRCCTQCDEDTEINCIFDFLQFSDMPPTKNALGQTLKTICPRATYILSLIFVTVQS